MATMSALAICIILVSAFCDGVKAIPTGFTSGVTSVSYHVEDARDGTADSIGLNYRTDRTVRGTTPEEEVDISIVLGSAVVDVNSEPRISSKYYVCIIKNNSFDEPKDCFDIEDVDNGGEVRVKRQINLSNLSNPNNVANGIELMKEVYENRRCIIKVMAMMAKMMSLLGNN